MDYFLFSAKLVPVGYGIKKLQIGCVVEDDKVSFLCVKIYQSLNSDGQQF